MAITIIVDPRIQMTHLGDVVDVDAAGLVVSFLWPSKILMMITTAMTTTKIVGRMMKIPTMNRRSHFRDYDDNWTTPV